jgi:hypothetical protein
VPFTNNALNFVATQPVAVHLPKGLSDLGILAPEGEFAISMVSVTAAN